MDVDYVPGQSDGVIVGRMSAYGDSKGPPYRGSGRTGHRRTGCNPVTSDDASVCPSASNGHSD